jgi:hypothetical protein
MRSSNFFVANKKRREIENTDKQMEEKGSESESLEKWLECFFLNICVCVST